MALSSIITAEDPGSRKRVPSSSGIAIQDIGEDKSLAYDLNTERGIVSSRVTMLLRSAEIKPMFYRFVLKENTSPPPRPFPEGVCPAGLVRVCMRTGQNTTTAARGFHYVKRIRSSDSIS